MLARVKEVSSFTQDVKEIKMKKLLLLGVVGLVGYGIKKLLNKPEEINPLDLAETKEDVLKRYNDISKYIIHLEQMQNLFKAEYIVEYGQKILIKDKLDALKEEFKVLSFKKTIFKALEDENVLEKMKVSLGGN